ncbi:MAG: ABC transporter ATP-binding protein [Actinobacteria bacterium]|nr:ABC transporter ATP-binding protein [Actinomycetota bacterium]
MARRPPSRRPVRLAALALTDLAPVLPDVGRLRRGAVVPAAIEVESISKVFKLFREKPSSLKARLISSRSRAEDFWALKDVSFDVREGESLGLIGHNGSGKTTLLKVIAGIVRPTSGVVRYRGRIAALLELGAGFHPELTGRENVYLNASFLGLSRKDTDRVYGSIVGFAELEDFMDNQVKFYSSGMLVRLGFAVAVHVDPDILLIDEVLAVGDESFQAKCLGKIRGFQKEGRTIVLVTHALDTVRQVCDRAVMLDRGELHAEGAPIDVVRELRYALLRRDPGFVPEEGTKEVELSSVELIREDGSVERPVRVGEDLTIQLDARANRPVTDLVASFQVLDSANFPVADGREPIGAIEGKKRVRFALRHIPLVPGHYFVTVGLASGESGRVYHVQTQRYWFEVVDEEGRHEAVELSVDASVEDL